MLEEAKVAANKIGYPLIIRAAYALGGLGSGHVKDEKDLVRIVSKAFSFSNIGKYPSFVQLPMFLSCLVGSGNILRIGSRWTM